MLASKETLSLDEIYKANNEITQLKQSLEREALFGEGRLPPDQVDQRERQYNYLYFQLALSARKLMLYDFIGRPSYPFITDLSDKQVSQEVDRLLLLLALHGIEILISDPHRNADDRKLFVFITEVVFKKEIKDIRMPGVCFSIDYNYYCPDHTHSCIFMAEELLNGLFEPDYDRLEGCLSSHFYVSNRYENELYFETRRKFDAYRAYVGDYQLIDWSIEDIILDESQRKSVVHLALHYGLEKNQKPLFTDKGHLVCYGKENNWWFIHRIDFPGLLVE
ncbi:hypothetical protein [Larkinella rosea]|uniref:Uncharacterized protein n=1 Tax=Larkinella rosea TaxID=2025312 RepID=A0A3P1BNJ3_9BACT|nr:hypothetical protein [Larkinella rosea]RRB02639.1 hypothetical protein EHT25_19520 [Larkinella rosea]